MWFSTKTLKIMGLIIAGFDRFAQLDISRFIIHLMIHYSFNDYDPEACLEPYQTSMMGGFAKMVNG